MQILWVFLRCPLHPAGAPLAWVQWVQLHPQIWRKTDFAPTEIEEIWIWTNTRFPCGKKVNCCVHAAIYITYPSTIIQFHFPFSECCRQGTSSQNQSSYTDLVIWYYHYLWIERQQPNIYRMMSYRYLSCGSTIFGAKDNVITFTS